MKQASRAQVDGMRWPVLEPIDGQRRPVALSKPVCVAGARTSVNLTLPSPLVSRSHALFVQDSDSVYVRDLASRNHVYVNETRVRESVISNGDVLRIGPFAFRFENRFGEARPHAGAVAFPPLFVTHGTNTLRLEGRTGVIGSREDCDVHVDDVAVDQVHSVLFERQGNWFIRDLPSSTGTFVNGEPVAEEQLKTGDAVQIGNTTLVCHLGEPDDGVISPSIGEYTDSVDDEDERIPMDDVDAIGVPTPPGETPEAFAEAQRATAIPVEGESRADEMISLAEVPVPEPDEAAEVVDAPIRVTAKVRPDDGIIALQVDPTEGQHDFAGIFAGAIPPVETKAIEGPVDPVVEPAGPPAASRESGSRAADAPPSDPEEKEQVLSTLLHELSENVEKIQTTWQEIKLQESDAPSPANE